jgi:hypothetical protein
MEATLPRLRYALVGSHTSSNGGTLESAVHGQIVLRVTKQFVGRALIKLSKLLPVDMTIYQSALPSNVTSLDI